MENKHEAEIKLEMGIADFSSKTVRCIGIQNVVNRTDSHRAGVAVVMTFTDGATGIILVRSGEVSITASPYARPRMANYLTEEEVGVVQAP